MDENKTYPEFIGGEQISENIMLCKDGKYRWVYALNLFTNPSIYFLVWKILFGIFFVGFAIMMLHDAISFDDFYPERLLDGLKFAGYFVIGMTVISALGYAIYAGIMGGKYIVMFEMDEQGINHKQVPEQAKKARKIAAVTTAAGAARGSLTTMGVGINAARTEMYSDFSKVKKVKGFKARKLIKVNGKLSRNQVYVEKEDYDFVKDYIVSHCSNL